MRKNIISIVIIGMLFLSSFMIVPTVGASGNTIYVDDDADPSWYNATHVKTIQEGIGNASSGDTIYVYNGTYDENVIINKSINLVGEDKEITIVDGKGGGFVFNITADHVNVSDFTIKNGSLGIKIFNTSNNIITDNIVKENSDCGISVYNWSNNSLIYRNNFIGNTIHATDSGGNAYDDGTEGNYWDDYTGEDNEPPYRIGDTPYNISGGDNQDRYPLMFPFGEIPPVADFESEVDEHSVQFHSLAYDPDGDDAKLNYSWEFGDGNNSNASNPVHEYGGEYTTYTVNLTVTDNDGYYDKISKSVTTGDTTLPVIHSVIPEKALYINNVKKGRTRLVRMALIIGDITIAVNATDENGSGIKQVNFTIDPSRPFARQEGNATEPDEDGLYKGLYTWTWEKNVIFRFLHVHTIKVTVEDNAGNINDSLRPILVRRFL